MPSLQQNPQQIQLGQSGSNSGNYLAMTANMMSSTTAGRQIHNAENKARLFIERQRKRTATLGVQRNKANFNYPNARSKLGDH